MRVTVTGAGGFVGSYLVEALRARGDTVDGWTRATVDVTAAAAVSEAVARFAPDAVVHLAAQSSPGRSWSEPAATYAVNVGGTIDVLEAARALAAPPRVLLAGTSAEYAEPRDGRPLAETAAIEPNSPYASSKVAADALARMYARRYDLGIVRFRPFFLVGPRKRGDVCSDFARRLVAIERGAEPVMRVGDLSIVRDFVDVRDGVDALLRLLDAGIPGEAYNICSGRGTELRDLLDAFRQVVAQPFTAVTDETLLRPLEQNVKIGDPAKLRALGWTPRHALDDTVRDILDYWRAS